MKELLVLMAAATPKEKILEDLIEAGKEASLVPSKDNYEKVSMYCHMYILNDVTKGEIKGATDVLKEMSSLQEKMKLFKTDSN